MNRTCETYQNRETDEVVGYMSGGCNSKTLSGCEVADEWKIGNNFKHLIANEEFLFDALVKKVALSEYYEQIILMVCVKDTGIGIKFKNKCEEAEHGRSSF
ncbi:Histidine kinase [Arachis hypogaea]|nr:Histidine kinase [Arachis hypogaea]